MARVAAVDCGTNSIRLLVADVTQAGMRDVHREMRVVRLGQGVDATGVLAPEAIERTRVALADYTAIMLRKGVERVRMVATSATRDAANRDDFFTMVRSTLGAEAEVISGDEEARLSFVGAVGELDPDDGPFVVVDVGGGSTEVVVGDLTDDGPVVRAARSVDIGCVRLTERCLPDDPPTAEQVEKARAVTAEILAGAFAAVPVEGVRTWVGVAGTVTTLSALAMDLPAYDADVIHLSRLSLPDLHRVTAGLLAMSREQRAVLGPMHPGRVDVIGGGAIVVDELARELHTRAGITELVASEHDILDGIARSLVARRATFANLSELDAALVDCRACPRLVSWREQVAREKRAAYRDEEYWGRPVPGLGPADAPLLIVGLAPAAHGGNRTGRMFTGDRSGDVLYAALYAAGLANQPTSVRKGDGLELYGTRITAPVHCAPPDNKPTPDERDRCGRWLAAELDLLAPTLRAVVVLGAFGWQALLPVLARAGWVVPRPRPAVRARRAVTLLPASPGRAPLELFGSYHVSQQNTFTGRLTPAMLEEVLAAAARAAGVDRA